MGIEDTRLLSEMQFNLSPLKHEMSYAQYIERAFSGLGISNVFGFAKETALENAQNTTDNISLKVNAYYLEKEQDEAKAEQEYYEKLNATYTTKAVKESYLAEMKHYKTYAPDSNKYKELLTKFNEANSIHNNAEFERRIAGDHLNAAGKISLSAFYATKNLPS